MKQFSGFINQKGFPKEKTEEYTKAFNYCMANGKSEIYAHAFADAAIDDYDDAFCKINAEAFELAMSHGMSFKDAYDFGRFFLDEDIEKIFITIDSFLRKYKEIWQKDFYLHQVVDYHDCFYKRGLTDEELENVKKKIFC